MKQIRLLALALAASAWCASAAMACDNDKTTAAHASSAHDCCSGTSATTAVATKGMAGKTCTAAMRAQCAGMKSASAANCAMHGTSTAMAAGSRCGMHKLANHADCTACADMAMCEDDVRAAGAHAQVISLKNGAMIVYTADSPESVRNLQAAVARHHEQIMAALRSGDSHLCSDCRQLRGAIASGKMAREIVNINGGCQVLMTATDRGIVDKIHAMTQPTMAVRVKS